MSMFVESIDPVHEYRHTPDETPAYNESTYYNFTSPDSGVVGWLRIAVQPNRPAGQATALLFLPEGETLMTFRRVGETGADALAVGPIEIEIQEPHRRQRLTFEDSVSVFSDPRVLADPGRAFREAPVADVRLDLAVTGNGDSFGAGGDDPANVLEESMALGHYEQFIRLDGVLRVNDREYRIKGGGLRDHSWGPRDWAGPLYYRWISASFDDGLAVMGLQVARPDGGMTLRAAVASGGVAYEAELGEVTMEWTGDGFCRRLSCPVKSALGDLRLTATARRPERFVPLRHHRAEEGTSEGVTRIGYSPYDFHLGDGRRGLGIVEVLDRLVDGRPVSMTR
ncbi:hypothetical protein [Actinomadura sp. NTSP31]|uniref:DUF7065 domain-containing protein n=1 Tax=Actinomadura sp. NTSP31 TaxID=1735447 RepID=UPI0035C08A1B